MPAGRSPSAATLARRLGPAAAGGILVGLLANGWSGLWQEAPGGRLAAVAAASSLPALVRATGIRRSARWATLAAAAAAAIALGGAVGSNPIRVVTADEPTWSRLADILPDGLGRAAAIPLPLAPEGTEALSALLVLVLAGAAALVAWQAIVTCRPLAAVVATATGLAYRWTLVPPDHPVLTGLATLVLALVAFRLAGPRPVAGSRTVSGRAVVVGACVTAIAIAGSIGAERAPAAWWNWESWTFETGRAPTTLDLNQRYGPLVYPDNPIVVARVKADEPIPLRAVTLDTFDGQSFTQSHAAIGRTGTTGDLTLVADASGKPETTTQTVSLTATRTQWLLAGGRPAEIRGLGRRRVIVFDDGSVALQPAIGPGTTYSVDTLLPNPSPADLLGAGRYDAMDPDLLTMLPGRGEPPVTVPAWGSGAPRPEAERFGQYALVYRLSRRVIGEVRTPYEAVNKVETYLRGPDFRYDETTPRAVGSPELVEFLLSRKTGYCQHFAGAMALMLRMNGIPARVAVGFTSDSGRFDPDKSTYEILDRDAHSWVEVQFPGFGWLPFDATPGRSVPNLASVSDPNYTREGIDIATDPQISSTPVQPAERPGAERNEPRVAPAAGQGDGGTGRLWLLTVPGLLLAALGAPFGLKALRRARRRRGGERERVLGATRELEALCMDTGVPIDPSFTPQERAVTIWRELGVDAGRIYGLASAARFAPTEPPAGAGREAWQEFGRARRTLGWGRRMRAGLRIASLRR